MFKNAIVYRIEAGSELLLDPVLLEDRLARDTFVPCAPTQMESAGWTPPRQKQGALVEVVGGEVILRLTIETKAVPGAVLARRLEEVLDKIEQDTGRRPKGKQAKELKEALVHEMLPAAFPKRASVLCWISRKDALLVVDSASLKRADAVTVRLVEATEGNLQLRLLQTTRSPSAAMSDWLVSQDPPEGFATDRECVLQQPDSEKASVRYARHTLDIEEVGEHIRQGKVPMQLAMTHDGRVSFVLTETMALRKLKLLDVALEAASKEERADAFDTDVALFTGEMKGLLASLTEALGGEFVRDPVAAPIERNDWAQGMPAGAVLGIHD